MISSRESIQILIVKLYQTYVIIVPHIMFIELLYTVYQTELIVLVEYNFSFKTKYF